jgi:hypothetical protein
MHKLKDMIDTVFGDVSQKPGAHSTSEVATQRDHRFREAANKIERLKQARLQAQSCGSRNPL